MLIVRCNPTIFAAIAVIFEGDCSKALRFASEAKVEEIARLFYGRHKLLQDLSPADTTVEILGRLGVKLSRFEAAQIRQLGIFLAIADCHN